MRTRTLLLSTMGLFLAANLFGQRAGEVININNVENPSMLRAAMPAPEGAMKSRAFDYNPRLRQLTAANKGDTLQLDYFDDRKFKAVISNVTVDVDGVLGITAHIVDHDFAACFISISDAGMSMRADLPVQDEQYRTSNASGQSTLSQYSLSETMKKTATPDIAVPAPSLSPTESPDMRHSSPNTLATDDPEANVTVDVMIIYTAKAKRWAEQNVGSIDNAINMAFPLLALSISTVRRARQLQFILSPALNCMKELFKQG